MEIGPTDVPCDGRKLQTVDTLLIGLTYNQYDYLFHSNSASFQQLIKVKNV